MRSLYHRILITGANGLVGQALVARLGARPDVDLLATGREHRPRFSHLAGGYTALDVTDPEAVRQLLTDFAPSAIIHCAAVSKVDECARARDACWQVNVEATAHLARQCRQAGIHLLLLSTDFVFDGADGPYAEDARPNPVNYYGRSKLAAENAVRAAGLQRWAIIRTTLAYGAAENVRRGNFGPWLVQRLRAEERTPVATDQIRTPTYVPDLADGIARAAVGRKCGVYHVAGREVLSVYEFATQIATQFGLDPGLLVPVRSDELHPDAPRPLRAGLLILRAESELGYRPRPLAEALADLGQKLGLPVTSG